MSIIAMDEKPKGPRIFANKVIKQLVGHMFADQQKMKSEDYDAIRVTYRSLGGSWDRLWHGDPEELKRLQEVVKAWAKLPHEGKGGLI